MDDGKKKQHDALMDEFKKVHRKMFAGLDPNDTAQTENNLDADSLVSDPEYFQLEYLLTVWQKQQDKLLFASVISLQYAIRYTDGLPRLIF